MDVLRQLLIDIIGEQAEFAARTLVAQYGTVLEVLRHRHDGLPLPSSIRADVGKRLGELSSVLDQDAEGRDEAAPDFGQLGSVMRYLKARMADHAVETFRVLFFNGANHLIDDLTMWTGTVDRVQVHVREVVRQALALDAVALIVAHNHTSVPPAPSEGDLKLTAKLIHACCSLDLRLNDHIIVGRQGCFSMRAGGILDRFEAEALHMTVQRELTE